MSFRTVPVRALLLAASLAGTACVSLETAAPPVAMLASGNQGSLLQGRDIYITRCAKCHSVEPVKKYSLAEWNDILPKMSEKTKLNPAENDAVRAYVLVVLKS